MPRQQKKSWPSICRRTARGRPSTSSPRPARRGRPPHAPTAAAGRASRRHAMASTAARRPRPPRAWPTQDPAVDGGGWREEERASREASGGLQASEGNEDKGGGPPPPAGPERERRPPGEGGGKRTREEVRCLPQGRSRAPAAVRELDRCRCRSAPAAARPVDRLPSAGSLRVFRLSLRPDPNSPQFLISDPLKPPTLAAGGAGGRAIRQAAERQAMGVPAAP